MQHINTPNQEGILQQMGVVNHGKQPKKSLLEKQVQADLLRYMKFLLIKQLRQEYFSPTI